MTRHQIKVLLIDLFEVIDYDIYNELSGKITPESEEPEDDDVEELIRIVEDWLTWEEEK
ncbi:hypothetical protein LCGC14_2796370 [marine sediment metagenome]|uniref:Uncharacterized protein n=1 Tax=marine sediment metagenome TaxID=412755 RepID=A0A0F9BFF1_9ZZZZ